MKTIEEVIFFSPAMAREIINKKQACVVVVEMGGLDNTFQILCRQDMAYMISECNDDWFEEGELSVQRIKDGEVVEFLVYGTLQQLTEVLRPILITLN